MRYERDGHVARVTISRPKVLNVVDAKTLARLNEIWAEIEADREVRVVVVTGDGDRAFCDGADMSADSVDRTGLQYWADRDPNGFGGLSLRPSLDVPVIARVNGYALGGGMEMMLGCDIVVAAENARFGLTEPRVGRIPLDGGVFRLVHAAAAHSGHGTTAHRPQGARGRTAPHGTGQRGRTGRGAG